MKHTLVIFFLTLCFIAHGQTDNKYNFNISAGLSHCFGASKCTAPEVNFGVMRNIGKGFSVGAETGLWHYEKNIVPMVARIKYQTEYRLKPYLDMRGGYGFCTSEKANGGICLQTNIGIEFNLKKGKSIFISAGGKYVKFERLLSYRNDILKAETVEILGRKFVCIEAGINF